MHKLTPGGVAEWLMATVCKTVRRKSYAGSNPAPTTVNELKRKALRSSSQGFLFGMYTKIGPRKVP